MVIEVYAVEASMFVSVFRRDLHSTSLYSLSIVAVAAVTCAVKAIPMLLSPLLVTFGCRRLLRNCIV